MDFYSECPACGGEGFLLGNLGSTLWMRCRSCGIDYQESAEADDTAEAVKEVCDES